MCTITQNRLSAAHLLEQISAATAKHFAHRGGSLAELCQTRSAAAYTPRPHPLRRFLLLRAFFIRFAGAARIGVWV